MTGPQSARDGYLRVRRHCGQDVTSSSRPAGLAGDDSAGPSMTDVSRHRFAETRQPIDLEPARLAANVAAIDLHDLGALQTREHFRERPLSNSECLSHPSLSMAEKRDLISPEPSQGCEMSDDSPCCIGFLRDRWPGLVGHPHRRCACLDRDRRDDNLSLSGSRFPAWPPRSLRTSPEQTMSDPTGRRTYRGR